jgi:hypothetical protein
MQAGADKESVQKQMDHQALEAEKKYRFYFSFEVYICAS